MIKEFLTTLTNHSDLISMSLFRSWRLAHAVIFALALSCAFPELRAADNDFAPPILSVTSHQNGQIVNTKTIVMNGSATDAARGGHGISSIYAKGTVAGASGAGNATVNWSQTITLNAGANNIEVYAYDNSETRNYVVQTITINFQPTDTLPPHLVVTSHVNGQTVNSKSITLAGTASDSGLGNNGISSVYGRGTVAGAQTTGAGIVTWSQSVTLNRGANYLSLYAYDDSDVKNSKVLNFVINFQPIDPLPPVLTVTSHANGQTVTSSTILLQGTATDAGRGDNGISSVYLHGTLPNINTAGTGTVNWSRSVDLRPGANYLVVYAYDNSDVLNQAELSLTINFQPGDTLAPLLSITSHANGDTVFTSSIILRGTATDAGRGDNGISSIYLGGTLPDAAGVGSGTVNWSKTVQLQPGRNYFTVYAYDRNLFPNEVSQTLTLNFQPSDTLGPRLAITSHQEGQTVNTSSITITGTASDAGRGDNGVSSVNLRGTIPNSTAASGATLGWTRTVELSPGRNFISVYAYDNSPFPNETIQNLTLNFQPGDALPPRLTVASHKEGQVVFTNVITVSGTATDAGRGDSGISAVRVNFNRAAGDTAVGSGVANWSRTFALNPGKNTIYVTAADGSEFLQETNITLQVTYQSGDVLPPTITINSPINNQTVMASSIIVSGTATDAGKGGNGVAGVTINGVAVAGATAIGSATANWSQSINLVRGANIISVVAVDNSNNRNTAAETVTVNYEPVELTPPTLTIISHRNNQTVSTSSITLSGTASDGSNGGNGISGVTVGGLRANGDTAVGSATANWTRTVNLSLGPNLISVVARDNSPNQNDTAQSITINYDPADAAPPDVEVTSHRNGQTVSTATIILAGTASDATQGGNGITAVTVNSLAATGGAASGAATALWTRALNLDLGLNLISIVARDNSPNQNSAALTMTIVYEPVDLTPPEVLVTSHRNRQTVLSDSITLVGTATDADRGDNGISSVTVNGSIVNGGTATGTAQAAWSKNIDLKLGENVISIVANDASPKLNSAAVTMILIYDPQLLITAADFCWARNGGGTGVDTGYAIALDQEGNSYITGAFEGSASFGQTNLSSRGFSDIFVAKYDSGGNLVWLQQAGGSKYDASFGIAVSTNGDCYVTGYFSEAAQFNGTRLTTRGTFDLFLAKYDRAGALLWATTTGKSAGMYGSAVAVDDGGNSYVTGSFAYDAFFGDETFLNNDLYDGFVAKYDAGGKLLWANQGGGEGDDRSTGIALDASGKCSITGYFADEGYFGTALLTSAGDLDLFVCQFDSKGAFQWVQQAGEFGETRGAAVSVDRHGNSLVTGSYDDTASFGTNTLFCDGFFDLFLAKYDGQGNLLWVRNTETSTAINGTSVATDAAGNSYLTGSFLGSATFGATTFTNTAVSDVFVAKYDSDGSFIWAKQAGGDAESLGFGIAATPAGTCYVTGSTSGLANFGNRVLTSNANADVFVAKLSDGLATPPAVLTIRALSSSLFELQFTGDTCGSYRLQASSDLQQWMTLVATNSPSGPVTVLESRMDPNSSRFFRVISP